MYSQMKRYGENPRHVRRSKTKFSEPLKWREGREVFTCSLSDFFIAEADGWRDEAWEVIRRTPQHSYQILTKRPERILDHLPRAGDWPWPHVWLGVTVESPAYLWRVESLRQVPAAVRFLSCEPLLADLGEFDLTGIHWVIAGGESGAQPRPMAEAWLCHLHEQCQRAEVPFFFKQWGGADQKKGGRLWQGRKWDEKPRILVGSTGGMNG
jgi:protein gp37